MSTAEEAEEWGKSEWFETRFLESDGGPGAYYGHALNGYQKRRHEDIVRVLQAHLGPCDLALDVGCGLGDLDARILERRLCGSIVGMDFVSSVIRDARRAHSALKCVMGALPYLPLRGASFDAVIASEVLYYLASKDRVAAFNELHSVLKPGGSVLFTSVLDNGDTYFELNNALALMRARFRIEHVRIGYNTFYKYLNVGAMRIIGVNRWFCGAGSWPSTKLLRVRDFLRSLKSAMVIGRVSGCVIRALSRAAEKALRSTRLPAALEVLSRLTLGKRGATNVIVLARKE